MRIVALLIAAGAACAQSSSPEQLFRDAVAAQQHGDDALAVRKYQELLKLKDPRRPGGLPHNIPHAIYPTTTQLRYPGIDAHRGTAHRRRRRLRTILQPRTALPGRRGGAATWRRCTGRPQIPGTP